MLPVQFLPQDKVVEFALQQSTTLNISIAFAVPAPGQGDGVCPSTKHLPLTAVLPVQFLPQDKVVGFAKLGLQQAPNRDWT